jgi:hypothetical protein
MQKLKKKPLLFYGLAFDIKHSSLREYDTSLVSRNSHAVYIKRGLLVQQGN